MDEPDVQSSETSPVTAPVQVKEKKIWFEMLMRSEQKNTACMKDIVYNFTKMENLLREAYGKKFSVAKSCMLL